MRTKYNYEITFIYERGVEIVKKVDYYKRDVNNNYIRLLSSSKEDNAEHYDIIEIVNLSKTTRVIIKSL